MEPSAEPPADPVAPPPRWEAEPAVVPAVAVPVPAADEPEPAAAVPEPAADEAEPAADEPGTASDYGDVLARSERVLDEIDGALARLDDGSYGRCATCGAAIGDDLLSGDPLRRACEAHLPLPDPG